MAGRRPVAARDDRQRLQLGRLVLLADPQEDAWLVDRVLQDREQRDAVLEHQHQVAQLRNLLHAVLGHEARGAVDVERVAGALLELRERGEERRQELPLREAERRVGQLRVDHPRADAHAAQLLVEVAACPVDQPRVERTLVRDQALRHAARGGDDDDRRQLRLQRQELDVLDRRGGDRRRGHDRQQVRDLRELFGGGAHRLVDLAPRDLEAHRIGRHGQRARLEHLVDVPSVAAVSRLAPGGCVRMPQEPYLLQARKLGAHGRRSPRDVGLRGEPLRADRLASCDMCHDHLLEQEALSLVDLHLEEFRSGRQWFR
jgi:hypothetical protein